MIIFILSLEPAIIGPQKASSVLTSMNSNTEQYAARWMTETLRWLVTRVGEINDQANLNRPFPGIRYEPEWSLG